jgi:hypothetical protein
MLTCFWRPPGIGAADAWHERLVRYYERLFGFRTVRAVTGGTLGDLPHMLVWGGAGTRMDADIPAQLRRWAGPLRAAARRERDAAAEAAGAAGPRPGGRGGSGAPAS